MSTDLKAFIASIMSASVVMFIFGTEAIEKGSRIMLYVELLLASFITYFVVSMIHYSDKEL